MKSDKVSGCYNITFIDTNQETDALVPRQQLTRKDDMLLQGHWGKEDPALMMMK